jgi:predicted  nucleic acid-binding Zn-ribbon protein
MSHQTLKSFIDLVTFDQRLVELQKKISQITIDLEKNQKLQAAAAEQLQQVSAKKQQAQKSASAQELLMTALQEQEQRTLQNLEALSGVKEYEAATKELDKIRVDRTAHEQKLIQLLGKVDLIDKEIQSATQQSQEAVTQLQQKQHEEEQLLQATKQELSSIENERVAKTINIPTEWLESYELMRGRVSDPVVFMV